MKSIVKIKKSTIKVMKVLLKVEKHSHFSTIADQKLRKKI